MAKKAQQSDAPNEETIAASSDAGFNAAMTEPDIAVQQRPVWPPPPRQRPRRSRVALIARVGGIALAALLVISGFILIIYSATTQYSGSLRTVATREAQATRAVIGTAQAQQQATVQVLGTAQAGINATATAQTTGSSLATATTDQATATATSLDDSLTQLTHGKPTFSDTLSDNTGQGRWDVGHTINSVTGSTGCEFKEGGYHVSEAQQGYLQPCIAQNTQFSNFVYQVQVTLNAGVQAQAGLLFQVTNAAYYFFYIGSDGSYALDIYRSDGQVSNLASGINTAIATGAGQPNQLSVLAQNGTYTLFANGQYLTTVSDRTLPSGKIGLAVVNRNTPADAQFTDAQIWKS